MVCLLSDLRPASSTVSLTVPDYTTGLPVLTARSGYERFDGVAAESSSSTEANRGHPGRCCASFVHGDGPGDRAFGCIGAVGAEVQGVSKVVGQLRVHLGNLGQGVADAGADGLAGTLCRVTEPSGAPTQSGGHGELVNESFALST
jgi:hypothetical protein